MACIAAPLLPKPQLPSPLSIPFPALDFSLAVGLNFCCQVHIASPTAVEIYGALGGPPLPPGPTINLAVINSLMGFIDKLNGFLSKLSVKCPFQ
jgi:hypothetical protein